MSNIVALTYEKEVLTAFRQDEISLEELQRYRRCEAWKRGVNIDKIGVVFEEDGKEVKK